MNFLTLTMFCSCWTISSVMSRTKRELPPALEEFKQAVRNDMTAIIGKNTLSLGDHCKIGTEAHRQALEKRLLSGMSLLYLRPGAHSAIAQEMQYIVGEMASLNGSFCNTFQNLECGANFLGQTKCQCARVSESVGFVAFFQREQNTCVLRPASMCAPQEMVDESSANSIFGPLPPPKIRCAKGSNCVVRRTGKDCTTEALQREFDRLAASHSNDSTRTAYAIAKSMEGICICGGIAVGYSVFLIVACILTVAFLKDSYC